MGTMRKPLRRIAVDLDGVLYEFVGAIRQYVAEQTGRPLDSLPYATCWDFHEHDWGMSTEEFLTLWAQGVSEGRIFWDLAPDPEGVAVLDAARSAGHELVIVTHRAVRGVRLEFIEEATRRWAAEHRVPHDRLIVMQGDKAEVATAHGIDLAIDDAPRHHAEYVAGGIEVWLFDQPWNRHVDGDRVHGWREVADRLGVAVPV